MASTLNPILRRTIMKTIITAADAALFAANVSAVEIYHGLANGNPDLFKSTGSQERASTGRPDIYMNVSGNPDLRF